MKDVTRQEHLEWCKKRALEYCDRGDSTEAMASMMSDIDKHPETEGHPGNQLAICLMMTGKLNSVEEVRRYINGYN